MKLSWHLLRHSNFIQPWPKALDPSHVAEQLTMAGLELEQLESTATGDTVLTLNITPNRGDCLSVRGLSREIAALNHLAFHDLHNGTAKDVSTIASDSKIRVYAPEACPHYSGQWFSVPAKLKALPAEVTDALVASGISLVNSLVDLTNYVMLLVGQPLHAFDAAKIQALEVRFATENESFVALGNRSLRLTANTLVIADAQGVQAMAGVIGGQESSVSAETQQIFVESAHFAPEIIAGKARQYGLQTDAAYRFERGVDPALPLLALAQFSSLAERYLDLIPGDRVHQGTEIKRKPGILLTASHIERLLGFELHTGQIEQILTDLGMHVTVKAPGWEVIPPSFRFDISIEADLIEELVRIHGFQHIPTATVALNAIAPTAPLHIERLVTALVHAAYHEIISYSFISEDLHGQCFGNQAAIRLQNPLSLELAVLRTSLWPSLLHSYLYNQDRQQSRAKLFETGLVYSPNWNEATGTYAQPRMLAGLMSGAIHAEQWSEAPRVVDFFDCKADVEKLLRLVNPRGQYRFEAAAHSMLHPGQSAVIYSGTTVIGHLGQLHPQLQQQLGLHQAVFLFELSIDQLPLAFKPVFSRFSKFPTIKRRFAFFVKRELVMHDFCAVIRDNLAEALVELVLFDVYQGKGVAPDEKSVAFSITLEDPKQTWTDAAIQQVSDDLVATLNERFGARLRDGS